MSFYSSVSFIPLKDLQLFTLLRNGAGVIPAEVNTDSSSPSFGKSLLNLYSSSPLFGKSLLNLLCAYLVLGGKDMIHNFIDKIIPDFIKFIPG